VSKILKGIKEKFRLLNPIVCGFLRITSSGSLIIIFVSTCYAEAIFKGTDKDGLPIFSDREVGALEKITILPANSIEVLKSDTTGKQGISERQEDLSYEITIESPMENHTYRNNEAVLVAIETSPKLRTGTGDRIVTLIDGSVYNQGQAATKFRILPLERGSHQIVAIVTDITGRELARSEAKTFFVQKTSIINRARFGN